jgi:hypothetical protein
VIYYLDVKATTETIDDGRLPQIPNETSKFRGIHKWPQFSKVEGFWWDRGLY